MRAIWGDSRVPRPARDRRARPPPAREARGDAGAAGADPDRARSGIPAGAVRLPGCAPGSSLALFATAAATLAVAALALLPPLEARLRERRRAHADAARRGGARRASSAAAAPEPAGCCARSRARPAPQVVLVDAPRRRRARPTRTLRGGLADARRVLATAPRPSTTVHGGVAQAAIPLRDRRPRVRARAAPAARRRRAHRARSSTTRSPARRCAGLAARARRRPRC